MDSLMVLFSEGDDWILLHIVLVPSLKKTTQHSVTLKP